MKKKCIPPLLWNVNAQKTYGFALPKASAIMKSLFYAYLLGSAGLVYATDNYAQTTMVSINMKNQTVKEVLNEIENSTEYTFFYNNRHLDLDRKVSVDISNGDILEVLEDMFGGTNVTYTVKDKNIVFSVKEKSPVVAQDNRKITGIVADVAGIPIIGANVMVKGTSNGTITDMDGNFTLDVPAGAVLQISYIGYANQEVKVGKSSKLSITLKEDTELLDEVVVVGYGTTSAKKMVSAVTAVKGEKLQGLPDANLTNSLQGRVSGLVVQNSGGEPGSESKISIRGGGSPLYVIDGVVSSSWDFKSLNPDDIESMSVLKDAASLAVYGSRAADGIILVKTKEGKKGKTSINYSFSAQFSQPTFIAEKVDALTYANVQNQAASRDGLGENAIYSQEELEIIRNQSDPYRYPNTDWYSLGLKNFAPEYRHSLSINGNQKNLNYYVSLGAFQQGSLYVSDALNYERYTVRSNVNTNFDEIGLKVSFNINGALEKKKYPGFSAGTIWDHLRVKNPLEAPYNPDGTLSSISDHPLMEMDKRSGYDKDDGMFVNTQLLADWTVPGISGLTLGAMINYRLNASHLKGMHFRAPQYEIDGTLLQTTKPTLYEKANFGNSYNFESYISYNRTFADVHSFDFKTVFTVSENEGFNFEAYRKDYLSTAVDQLFAGSSIGMTNYGSASEGGRIGLVGRLKYDYDNRYYIEGSFRYDGSDNFAPGYRWGFFPSIAIAWDITEEDFFKDLNLDNVNLLKIRATYGKIGSESGVNRFGYLPTYSLIENAVCIGGNLYSGYREGNLVAPEELSWYSRDSYNIGIDYSLFKNRLKGSIDYFFYITKGGLMSPKNRYTTPLGTSLPQIKSDSEHRREGFEISLKWEDEIENGFTYGIGTNMTYYNNLYAKNVDESLSSLMNPYQRSTQVTDFYGLLLVDNGLYQSIDQILSNPRRMESTETKLGDIAYKDINGDGKINGEDQIRYGMPTAPHFSYGIDFFVSYKGLSLSGLFSGTGRRSMMFGYGAMKAESANVLNEYQLDYWRPDNTDAVFPRVSRSAGVNGENNRISSTFYVRNAAFLRLKNLSLSYDFKYSLLKDVSWLTTCRLNITGSNLFTISGVSGFWDPEIANTNAGYPVSRIYSLGLTIGF